MHDEEILGKAYDARLMRRLLQYLWPYRLQVLMSLAAIITGSVLQLAQPYLMKVVIDEHIATGNFAGVNRLGLLFLMILLVAFALEYAQTVTMQMTGQRIMFDMRMQVYQHLQRLDLSFYDRNPVGRLMTRVTTDVDVLNDLFTSGVVAVFGDVFTLAGIMIVMLVLDWKLALVTFAVLPLILLVTHWFRTNVRHYYRLVRTRIARINAYLQENITGMATVQLFARERAQFERFDDINRQHRNANVDSIFYYAVFYPAIEVIGALAAAVILLYGGGRVITGGLTVGSLVAFLQYSQRFFRPISDMSEKFNVLQTAMASSERIFGLLDTPVRVAEPRWTGALAGGREEPAPAGLDGVVAQEFSPAIQHGRIVFDNVSFAYVDDEYVLRDISFAVEPGQRVAIVGATGSGKTTLVNLLLRFYDVRSGRITIDGVDVRDLPFDRLRSLFGLVLQDVHLFSGTIAGNIRLGNCSITDDQVRHAATAVHADTFITRLPGGFDSPVAERGATLSAGQKQLLSFARALAFNPRVLILDEATSSVDTETELLIRDALRVLMTGRTTIAIAHRLSTVQDADKILVLHKGHLRETGTHQELLALRGIYWKLYQLQYKQQEEGEKRQKVEERRKEREEKEEKEERRAAKEELRIGD